MWRYLNIAICTLLISGSVFALIKDPNSKEVCPEVCEPEKCPNVGPIGLSECPAEQYIVAYRCGCCRKCDVKPVTTTFSPTKRDEVCQVMICPKKKVCVLNIQGLPVCKCPTEELCKKFVNRGAGKKMKVCGSDSITYASRCHLKVASCASDGKIRVTRKGDCNNPEPSTESSAKPVTTQSTGNTQSTNGGKKHSRHHSQSRKSLDRSNKHNNNKRLNRKGEKKQQKRQNRKKEKNYQRALRAKI